MDTRTPASSLPTRPNLDHLRRQAKTLLSSLADGDSDAARTFIEHLPAAKGLTPAKARAAGFRLADAQSAIARRTGFASWPQLARHVDLLRSLEGSWAFDSLEVEGTPVPAAAIASSRLLIDGDRFRMESPEATYDGVFNIDVDEDPHHIDIEFIEGPEAGNTNRGIFRLDKDRLEFCLDMQGKDRPAAFRSAPGSGHAYEALRRESGARPATVTGGSRAAAVPAAPPQADPSAFVFIPSAPLTKLEGEWSADEIVRDGQALPAFMLKTANRSAKANEIRITVGGATVIHALVRIDDSALPTSVDYFNLGGACKGTLQHGIMEWRGQSAVFCMAAPGKERPCTFDSPPGSGRTLSVWTKK